MADEISSPGGAADSKLTITKRKWAEQGKFLTGRNARRKPTACRPASISSRTGRCSISASSRAFPPTRWKLDVRGFVNNPKTLDWAALQALPQSEMRSDIHCVTTWSRYDNNWKGVSTHDFLDLVDTEG